MTTHPGILIRWSPHAPETWTPRDADEPAPVPRGTPVVSVEGTPAVRLLRAAELGRLRDALHAHGLRVAVDTFDTLGPQSEPTRGVDVTLGWPTPPAGPSPRSSPTCSTPTRCERRRATPRASASAPTCRRSARSTA